MALNQCEQALFAREAIRTFHQEEALRHADGSLLNAHARRIAEQFNKNVLSPRLLSGLFGVGEFVGLTLVGLATLLFLAPNATPLLILPFAAVATAALAFLFFRKSCFLIKRSD